MRVWIEIYNQAPIVVLTLSFHPLMRVWIEIDYVQAFNCSFRVSPSYEGVD